MDSMHAAWRKRVTPGHELVMKHRSMPLDGAGHALECLSHRRHTHIHGHHDHDRARTQYSERPRTTHSGHALHSIRITRVLGMGTPHVCVPRPAIALRTLDMLPSMLPLHTEDTHTQTTHTLTPYRERERRTITCLSVSLGSTRSCRLSFPHRTAARCHH